MPTFLNESDKTIVALDQSKSGSKNAKPQDAN